MRNTFLFEYRTKDDENIKRNCPTGWIKFDGNCLKLETRKLSRVVRRCSLYWYISILQLKDSESYCRNVHEGEIAVLRSIGMARRLSGIVSDR